MGIHGLMFCNPGAYRHMRNILILALSACLGLLSFAAQSDEDVTPLPFHDLPAAPATQIAPWAVPLAGGPLHVLAIVPYSTLGDLDSLRASMEIDLEVVTLWDRSHLGFDPQFPEPWFPDATYEKVEQRLLRLLDKGHFDIILIGHCELDAFPETVQQQIVDHASNGSGLLVTGLGLGGNGPLANWLRARPTVDAPALLVKGLGPMGITRADQEAIVQCYADGENRAAYLTFENAPSPNHALIPVPENPFEMLEEYEADAFSLLCKALLWAAHREPTVSITSLIDVSPKGPDDEEIPPGYPPEFIEAVRKNAFNQPVRPFILNLDAPAEDAYEVIYQIRLPGASLPAIRINPDTVLPKGATYYPLDVIAAPGNYLVDVWLKNRKGVVTWYTELINVPGWPQLKTIEVKQDGQKAVWLKPNDHLDVSAEVEPIALFTSGQEATVFVRATDSYGRQVASASQVVGAAGGPVNFRLDLADLFAPLIKVEVYAVPSALVSEASLVNQAAREFFYFPVRLPDPAREPVVVLSTGGPFDYGSLRQINRLRDLIGARILHAPLNADSLLASSKSGLNRIAQLGSLDGGEVGPGPVRVPCLSDPEIQQREAASIASGVLQAWAGGAPYYSLGAGCALTSTEDEVCQSRYCLDQFRDYLKAHYSSLDTLNTAWRESFKDWNEVVPSPLDQCQQNAIWAPWLDFRRSMDRVFANAHRRGREAIHTADPSGRLGFQARYAGITPMTGYDWKLLAAQDDYLAVPPEPGAIRRLQSFHGPRPCGGIVLGQESVRGEPARVQWTAWNALFHQLPAIWLEEPFGVGPDSLISPLGELRPGLAALASALSPIQQGIGTLLLNAAPHPTGIAFVDSTATRYLDYASAGLKRNATESENGLANSINRNGFSAGVVSLESVDPSTALAGVNTLLLCRTRALSDEEVALLKTFHDNNGLIIADGRPGEFDGHGTPRAMAALPYLHPLDPEKREDEEGLWTNRPVWVSQMEQKANGEDAILAHLLARAGNVPLLPVDLPEKQQGSLNRYQYTFGAATLAAFLAEPGVPSGARRASFKIPEDHFAVDLLHPTETTPRGRVQWTISPGEPALFSILPYRVKRVLVEAPDIAVAGHRATVRVVLDTEGAAAGTHLILLQLEGPDRKERVHYRQCIPMEGGSVETFIPLAQNEVPGHYVLNVCDLLSQQRVAYALDIES